MFVPLYDVNALKHIRLQYVTIGLIVVNVLVWLVRPDWAARLGALVVSAVVFPVVLLAVSGR